MCLAAIRIAEQRTPYQAGGLQPPDAVWPDSQTGRLIEIVVQNPVQSSDNSSANSGAAASRGVSQEIARNDISRCEPTAYAKSCDDLPRPAKITSGEDRNRTPQENAGNSSISVEGGANSGAVADLTSLPPDLARIVAAWPTLPAAIQRAILALLDCQQ